VLEEFVAGSGKGVEPSTEEPHSDRGYRIYLEERPNSLGTARTNNPLHELEAPHVFGQEQEQSA
jgi:hypothetical protein